MDDLPDLISAARAGCIDRVRALLEGGAEADAPGIGAREFLLLEGRYYSPLMAATQNGHAECARLLIDSGADVNRCDEAGWTPLAYAVVFNRADCARLFLERGAAVDKVGEVTKFDYARRGRSPTPPGTDMDDTYDAYDAYGGYSDFSTTASTSSDTAPEFARTPLMHAVTRLNMDMTRLLLDKGADINKQTTEGETPLMLALMETPWDEVNDRPRLPDMSMLEYLLERGANPNIITPTGDTALLFAIGQVEIDKEWLTISRTLLLYSADPNQLGYTSPLFRAMSLRADRDDATRLLLHYFAKPTVPNHDNITPLEKAIENDDLTLARRFLRKGGPGVTIQPDAQGRTMLKLAMDCGCSKEVIREIKLAMRRDAR